MSSKLASGTKRKTGVDGKGARRTEARLQRYIRDQASSKETRHQHHEPGSQNARKNGKY